MDNAKYLFKIRQRDDLMIVVGLTGGIATGKSFVSQLFERCGAIIVDADRIARQVVEPGSPAWHEIREQFGDQIVKPDQTLDRPRLAELVFNDSDLRCKLEAIIHPRVQTRMDEQVLLMRRTRPGSVVILDIPLLMETGMDRGLNEIIVVYAASDVQRRRLLQRDNLTADQATARIDSQMCLEEKRRRATIVIDNSGDRKATEKQVVAVFKDLTQRARRDGRAVQPEAKA